MKTVRPNFVVGTTVAAYLFVLWSTQSLYAQLTKPSTITLLWKCVKAASKAAILIVGTSILMIGVALTLFFFLLRPLIVGPVLIAVTVCYLYYSIGGEHHEHEIAKDRKLAHSQSGREGEISIKLRPKAESTGCKGP